jgi:secreted Zn-dependent insulinase-like peptidase
LAYLSCHQAGDSFYSPKIAAALLMLHQYMKEPIFTNLRTKQQLGYIVSLSHETYGV